MTDVDQLYQAAIVDHDRNPRNHGPLDGATHEATIDNPLCGDVVAIQLQVDGDAIRDIRFEGRGCALSRAAASMMTGALRDRPIAEARALASAFEAFVRAAPDSIDATSPGSHVAPADPSTSIELGELAAFAGVRKFRSRQACATLAFRALLAALDRGAIAR
jgi:nitrogen fixation protein NifU and related proteins